MSALESDPKWYFFVEQITKVESLIDRLQKVRDVSASKEEIITLSNNLTTGLDKNVRSGFTKVENERFWNDVEKARHIIASAPPALLTHSPRSDDASATGQHTVTESAVAEDIADAERPMRDREVRTRALAAVRSEKEKEAKNDRLSAGHSERGRRARSSEKRRGEKSQEGLSVSERAWRLGILLRSRAYDSNRFKTLPNTISVQMKRWQESDEDGKITPHKEMFEIAKSTLEEWLKNLEPHEQQRLYVIGRKKIEFPFDEDEYPQWKIRPGDNPEEQARKKAKMEGEQRFQKEQKELADALEVVAIPMLKSAFAALGEENVDVYLSGLPDDLAGGIDTIVEFKNRSFSDGSPMVLVIDVTYARMRDKLPKEMKKGRVGEDAEEILKGDGEKIDPALSNARAMKLFRTLVETLGSMSTQTFDKHGPLKQPREHMPRLIIGLDYDNAFSTIINWVEKGDDFEAFFRGTGLARRIATSVRKQLVGLHAFTSADKDNPNTSYLSELLREVGTEPLRQLAYDRSLNNLDDLLTIDPGYSGKQRRNMDERELKQLARRKKAWRLRQRFYDAARAQVAYDRARGGRMRGDRVQAISSSSSAGSGAKEGISHEETIINLPSPPTTIPEYSSGVSLSKYDSQEGMAEAPTDRAKDFLREINQAWAERRMNAAGERVVLSKKGKKETSWGEWLVDNVHEKIRNWSDKEKVYIRSNMPQRMPGIAPGDSTSAAQQTDIGERVKDTESPARLPDRERQTRIAELEREIAALRRKGRIRDLERQIAEAKARSK